jgi:hypothetical protein
LGCEQEQAKVVHADLDRQREAHEGMSAKLGQTKVPAVMDYVRQTSKEHGLLKSISVCGPKVVRFRI